MISVVLWLFVFEDERLKGDMKLLSSKSVTIVGWR